jgi:hypothetical protein
MSSQRKYKKNTTDSDDSEFDGSDLFKAYFEYNKVLLTWFVAFGIGGPALFLVNDDIVRTLNESQNLICVATLFLTGATSQVVGSLINKIANWYVYIGTISPEILDTRRHKLSEWLINQFWIDIAIDLITIISFGWAVWTMIIVYGKAS